MTPHTWLITGSSRGFGRALAQAALDAGDQVVATARAPAQLLMISLSVTAIGSLWLRWM
jgi:NAD(P)-dependent dehydrogenase (short-subunit alcohol dehydrogenase family)